MELFFRKKEKNSENKKHYYNVTDEEVIAYANNRNEDLKVKQFTHTDIAGVTCSVLAKRTFSNIDVTYCSNNEVNDIVNTFITIDRKFSEYDVILLTDVSLDEGSLINLEKVVEITQGKTKVIYLNHQESNLKYNDKYSCALIEPMYDGVKQDSASLTYRYLINNYSLEADEWLSTLVEKSRRYTRWEWKALEDEDAHSLSMLCHDIEETFFANSLIKKHISNDSLLNEEDLAKVKYLTKKYESYRDQKITEVIITKIGTYKVGFLFAEQYINELGADVASKYSSLDSIVLINSLTKFNFRTGKKIDVTEIAKIFGGNGQKYAAGASIPVDIRENIIKTMVSLFQERSKRNIK